MPNKILTFFSGILLGALITWYWLRVITTLPQPYTVQVNLNDDTTGRAMLDHLADSLLTESLRISRERDSLNSIIKREYEKIPAIVSRMDIHELDSIIRANGYDL